MLRTDAVRSGKLTAERNTYIDHTKHWGSSTLDVLTNNKLLVRTRMVMIIFINVNALPPTQQA